MNTTLLLAASLVLSHLSVLPGLPIYLVAQADCPPQPFLDPNTCPVKLDASKIAVDPYTNKMCLLAWKFVPEASQWRYTGSYCDDDSDPMTITAEGAPLVDNKNGTYTISGAIGPAGQIIYATMTLVDKPPGGDAITRKGTVAIISVKKNNPPSLN